MNKIDFSELTRMRQSWVKSTNENGFDEGITNLLIELYPDNAHFIYELLQNAEDTGASEVAFELFDDKLKFSHNGKKFNEEKDDITGITSIGKGTKADDINSIGKFGVGFKAVFVYTSTPEIYSGDYNFKIVDLIVPIAIENNFDNQDTIMIFPFNHKHSDKTKEKTKEKAYKEIKGGLEKIEDNVLLFLTSIQKLKFIIDSNEYYIEQKENNEKITITNTRKSTITHWLRFKKYLKNSEKLYVSIAYNLDDKKENIQPIKGQVSIFFPAEKESSNLKFHIHAPFASTVARDSIKDLEENNELRNLITELTAQSLFYIKENKLLNFNFLSCLANTDDNLSSFYRPIQNAFIEEFNTKNYIQVSDNIYKPASQCYIGSEAIKEFISIELLKKFIYFYSYKTINSELYWINKIPKSDNRAYKFMETLDIGEFTDRIFTGILNKLVDVFVWKNHYYDLEILKEKSEEWFSKLYAYCYRQYHNKCIKNLDNYKKNIKLLGGSLNLEQKNCYFSEKPFSDYLIVNSLFKENREAYEFLKLLDVKEIEVKERIEAKLKSRYKNGEFPDIVEHLDDIKEWTSFYKASSRNEISFFKEYYFIKVIDKDSKHYWSKVKEVYLDKPFLETGMREFLSESRVYLLDDIYLKLEKEELKIFISMLKVLGANFEISIEKITDTGYYRVQENYNILKKELNFPTESNYCRFVDYCFFHPSFILKSSKNKKVSLMIWNQIRNLPSLYFVAKYKAHARSGEVKTFSTLIHQLKEYYFIPSKNGNYYNVANISAEMLSNEFIYDDRNGWLTHIGFGENVKKNQEDYKEKEKIISNLTGGHDIEDIEKLKDVDPDEFRRFLEQQKQFNLFGAIENLEGEAEGRVREVDPSIVTEQKKYLEQA